MQGLMLLVRHRERLIQQEELVERAATRTKPRLKLRQQRVRVERARQARGHDGLEEFGHDEEQRDGAVVVGIVREPLIQDT